MSFHSMGTFEEKSAESSNKNIMKNVKCKYNFKKSWSIAPAPLGWIMQYSPNKCFVLNLKPFLFRLGFATLRSLAKEFLFCEISHFLLRQKKKSFRERIFLTFKILTVLTNLYKVKKLQLAVQAHIPIRVLNAPMKVVLHLSLWIDDDKG